MQTSLDLKEIHDTLSRLELANHAFGRAYPGEPERRQPVHTVYGGAQLFKADGAQKLGQVGMRTFKEYAPDFVTWARVLNLPGVADLPGDGAELEALKAELAANPAVVQKKRRGAWMAYTIYNHIIAKMNREPIEDFRIDFEDGYGHRPDPEEDGHAVQAAGELARGMEQGTLPPYIGIRIKPFNEELRVRALRTLDVFLTALAAKTGGRLPPNFVVTLPKVTVPEQVSALAEIFDHLERKLGIAHGALKMELMIEMTMAIIGPDGTLMLPRLLGAARDRIVAAHFGTYDYTACCNITAAYQSMTHPSCDFARHMMQVAYARTGIWMSDGATTVMPIPPHRPAKDGPPLTEAQKAENQAVVHRAWKLHFDQATDSMMRGFYQGWDLHPAQLPTRYAAVYAFFLDGLDAAADRLRNFIEKAAQATLVGDMFDDAATGQGLLNYFLRSMNCGLLTEDEVRSLTGLTHEELLLRSFAKILERRKK